MPISNIILLEQMKLKVHFLVNLYLIKFKLDMVAKFTDYTNLQTTPLPPHLPCTLLKDFSPHQHLPGANIFKKYRKKSCNKVSQEECRPGCQHCGHPPHTPGLDWSYNSCNKTQKTRLSLPQVCKQKED